MTFEGSYCPGSWIAVTTPTGWLLADLPVADPRVADAWTLLRSGADTDSVLDALLASGIARLPPFALACLVDDGLRLVVRRPAIVTITRGAETTVIDSSAASWHDSTVALPADRIVVETGQQAGDVTLPVGLGITQAGALILTAGPQALSHDRPHVQTSPVDPVPVPVPVPRLVEVPDPVEPAGSGYADLFAGTEDRNAFLARIEADESVADDDPESPAPTVLDHEPTPEEAADVAGRTAVWRGAPADQQPAPPAAPVDTQIDKQIEKVAASGLIDGLPWTSAQGEPETAPPTPGAPSAPVEGPVVDDVDVRTMNRAELLASLATPAIVGPSVVAVRCSSGHLTPPMGDRCRVCSAPVDPSNPSEVPRPILGVLRRPDGEVVTLDRDVIFGRAPQATASRASSQPNLVKISDPGVSRNHAHVALDGWQVMVRDLGSSNGTELQLPGREAEQLRPNEDYLLEPGAVVTLAGEVHLTFEVTG